MKEANEIKDESRRTFDGQADNYDKGIDGKHARQIYPVIIEAISAAAPKSVQPRTWCKVLKCSEIWR